MHLTLARQADFHRRRRRTARAIRYRADCRFPFRNQSAVTRNAGRGTIQNLFGYDARGRKVVQNDPDSGTVNYSYNALGELVAQQDAAGNRIELELDARGRVWRKTVKRADGTVETQSGFVFDTASNGVGQPASETMKARTRTMCLSKTRTRTICL